MHGNVLLDSLAWYEGECRRGRTLGISRDLYDEQLKAMMHASREEARPVPRKVDPLACDSGHYTNVSQGENGEGKNTHTSFYHNQSILERPWMILGV